MTTAIAPSNSRGMGWRKPVPVYVPTPPSSRPTSDTFAPTFSGGDAGKQLSAEAPKDGLPPVSPLLLPCFPTTRGESRKQIDPFSDA